MHNQFGGTAGELIFALLIYGIVGYVGYIYFFQ